jgi:glucose 1-dehydrogenase
MKGKVAIVTGAATGIGYAIAQELLARGTRVLLNDSDANLATTAARQLGTGCHPLPGDAADLPFIKKMVTTAVKEFGRLDITIANAGLTVFGDFLSYTPEMLEKILRLNLTGSFFLAQAAAQQMKQQGEGGSILFTSSVTGHQAHKGLVAYGMTKAALEMLAKGLVIELSPHHITVNTVAPGATMTERTAEDPTYEKTWSQLTPMGRPARPEDIAKAVAFLVSSEARHITGQTVVVDGGWIATSPGPQ